MEASSGGTSGSTSGGGSSGGQLAAADDAAEEPVEVAAEAAAEVTAEATAEAMTEVTAEPADVPCTEWPAAQWPPLTGLAQTPTRPVRLRPLPDGFVAVFSGKEAAKAFLDAHAEQPPPSTYAQDDALGESRDPSVPIALSIARAPPASAAAPEATSAANETSADCSPIRCTARPLSSLQRRSRAGGGTAGRGTGRGRGAGAPRQLAAALRGLGGGAFGRGGARGALSGQ